MELQVELMIFTIFMCLAAGTFAVQGLLSLLGRGDAVQMPALIVSLVALIAGGIAAFMHLQHWDRIFGGFGHLTSGITQEFIAIAVFVVALVVYFVVLRRFDTVPKWAGAMALVIGVVLVIIMALSYNMPSRPAWNTPLLWLYYLCNAAFLGALTVACIEGIRGSTSEDAGGLTSKASWITGIICTVVVIGYAIFLSTAAGSFASVGSFHDYTNPAREIIDVQSSLSGILSGDLALLFWLGVVVVGLAVPIVLAFFAGKKKGTTLTACAGIGLVCALIGAGCFRVILYALGYNVFMLF